MNTSGLLLSKCPGLLQSPKGFIYFADVKIFKFNPHRRQNIYSSTITDVKIIKLTSTKKASLNFTDF